MEVVIVDEYTGRKMVGRQWSDGLHQAVEAKERVPIKQETQTLATITLQNFFKLYKSSGRHDRHGPDRGRGVHQDLQAGRRDDPDQPPGHPRRTTKTASTAPSAEKWDAIIEEIKAVQRRRAGRCSSARPASRRARCSRSMLKRKYGIEHEVLNAK